MLKDAITITTGAGRGIGRATALSFAADGAKRGTRGAPLRKTRQAIRSRVGIARVRSVDLGDGDAAAELRRPK